MTARLDLNRQQILAFRRRSGALDERLPRGAASLRRAAWAGLQDSMPRAALFSIHARVEGTGPSTWEDPSLVQLWALPYAVYVVAARDLAVFSLGTLPEDAKRRRRAEDLAARLAATLDGRRMPYGAAGEALGLRDANTLRYAAATGTVLLRWDGARQATIWTVPAPDVDPSAARLQLARRYLHVYGPATPEAFARWSGIGPRPALAAFGALAHELAPVRTPIGEASVLARDEAAVRGGGALPAPAAARLLPGGDPYFLQHGAARQLLVPDPACCSDLWTPRVWPGAVLVAGEIAGTWRRAGAAVTVQPWRKLSAAERDAVVAEAESLPLPAGTGKVVVHFGEGGVV